MQTGGRSHIGRKDVMIRHIRRHRHQNEIGGWKEIKSNHQKKHGKNQNDGCKNNDQTLQLKIGWYDGTTKEDRTIICLVLDIEQVLQSNQDVQWIF